MSIELLIGITAGIALTLGIFILRLKWIKGRGKRKGKKGEKIVASELGRLSRRDHIVLNDLLIPVAEGRTSQIDHIVVGRKGIFVIETKSLSGRISGSEHSQYWTQHLSQQSRQFYNPLLQNRGHIRALRKLLPYLDEESIISVVVFTEAWRLDLRADDFIIPRRFLRDRRIRRTFIPSERIKRRWWKPGKEVRLDDLQIVVPLDELIDEISRRKRILNREEMSRIADHIRELSIEGGGAGRAHTAYAQETSRRISRQITQGNCPRCGGRLLIKKGDRGEFVGCENYPQCRFSCSIDRLKCV